MGDGMPIVEIDKRGRMVIPKEIRRIADIKSKEKFFLRLENKEKLILEKVEKGSRSKKDPLIELINNPIHVSPERIKKIDLEEVEEELWLGK